MTKKPKIFLRRARRFLKKYNESVVMDYHIEENENEIVNVRENRAMGRGSKLDQGRDTPGANAEAD